MWVTYPAVRPAKRKGNGVKPRRAALKLWAVVIVEALRQTAPFSYEVTLKRIYKRDDRTIKVWVSNDPDDQSEEACVFGVVSPPSTLLTSLEQYLSRVVAKRVYDAIVQTWPGEGVSGAGHRVIPPPLQLCPEGADWAATALSCGPSALGAQVGRLSLARLVDGLFFHGHFERDKQLASGAVVIVRLAHMHKTVPICPRR